MITDKQKEDAKKVADKYIQPDGTPPDVADKAFDDVLGSRTLEEEAEAERGKAETQAQILIKIAAEAALFHAPNASCFADIMVKGHRETWPIRSQGFRRWLMRGFYDQEGNAPSANAMQAAIALIEAKAHFDGPEHEVHVRSAGHDGKIYLDLADEQWRAVEIDAAGWRVIARPPVKFRRAAGMQPLPIPVSGGSVTSLRPFLNVKNDDDFVLAIAWLLAALRDCGPYPVLALAGEQGSAKSTFSTILRSLVDPNTAPLRALPREDRDLFIAANNGHTLAFDNVSGLPSWISDTLCRLATGGGFAVRQLYTDQDEVLFDSCRPIILNGIEDCITRPDLADRSLFLTLEAIPEDKRKAEKDLFAEFDRQRPHILGALLDAVSHGLKRLPEVRLDRLPRMADFAKWATACETQIWVGGTFRVAYGGNRAEAVNTVLEADEVASALRAHMAAVTEWTGTSQELLGALSNIVGEKVAKEKWWPKVPNKLSQKLRRMKTFLRQVGIEVRDLPRQGKRRALYITREEKVGNSSSPSSSSSPSYDFNGLAGDGARDGKSPSDGSDGTGDGNENQIVTCNQLKNTANDDSDGSDGQILPFSRCRHCGRGGDVQEVWYGDQAVQLHARCQEAWRSAQENDELTIPAYLDRRHEVTP
jgi:hypothetical protein